MERGIIALKAQIKSLEEQLKLINTSEVENFQKKVGVLNSGDSFGELALIS